MYMKNLITRKSDIWLYIYAIYIYEVSRILTLSVCEKRIFIIFRDSIRILRDTVQCM